MTDFDVDTQAYFDDLIKTHHGFGSITQYQDFHDLKQDGIIGPVTARSLNQLRYCSYGDNAQEFRSPIASPSNLPKWGHKVISWTLHSSIIKQIQSFSQDDLIAVTVWAFQQWANVCDLKFEYIPTHSNANITLTAGKIDGKSGTLAWSELPNSSKSTRPLKQKYDSHEPFVFSQNPPRNKIDLGRVMCHEIGHALGISHLPMRDNALMSPTYSNTINKPTDKDIQQIVARYGLPQQPTVPGTLDPLDPLDPIGSTDPNLPKIGKDEFVTMVFPRKWIVGA